MGGSNHQELIVGSSHLRIQSSHLIFTFCAGLHSSVFTCGNFTKIFCLHFFTLPEIMSSLSSHLSNHNLQSSQKPGQAPIMPNHLYRSNNKQLLHPLQHKATGFMILPLPFVAKYCNDKESATFIHFLHLFCCFLHNILLCNLMAKTA